MSDTFDVQAPSLKTMVKRFTPVEQNGVVFDGNAFVVSTLVSMLTDYVRFVNAKSTLTTDQIKQVCELILEDYSHLSLIEFKLFFKWCKMDKFEKNYNRVDGPTILRWLDMFEKQWYLELDNKRMQEHERIKNMQYDYRDIAKHFECPEHTQRFLNEHAGYGSITFAERDQLKKKEEIRKRVIKENLSLYQTTTPDKAAKLIDEKISISLMAEGIF